MNLLAIVLVLVAFGGLHWLRERDERRLAEERRAEQERWVRAFEARVEADRLRAQETQAFMQRMMEQQATQSTAQLESMIRLVTSGVTEARAAVIQEREPDATEMAARVAVEQTIQRGIEELREGYRAMGIQASDDELRQEVEMMLAGVPMAMPREAEATAVSAAQAARP